MQPETRCDPSEPRLETTLLRHITSMPRPAANGTSSRYSAPTWPCWSYAWRVIAIICTAPVQLAVAGAMWVVALLVVAMLACTSKHRPCSIRSVRHRCGLVTMLSPCGALAAWLWVPLCWKQRVRHVRIQLSENRPTAVDTQVIPAGALPAPRTASTRIVAVSDTHGLQDAVLLPRADVLLHAGDALSRNSTGRCCCGGARCDMRRVLHWLADASAGFTALVGGNHDAELESGHHTHDGIVIVNDHAVQAAPNGWRIFTSPWSPNTGSPNHAFQTSWKEVVQALEKAGQVDVVMTHAASSRRLGPAVERSGAWLHIAGHVHEAAGVYWTPGEQVVTVVACVCSGSYWPFQPVTVIDVCAM